MKLDLARAKPVGTATPHSGEASAHVAPSMRDDNHGHGIDDNHHDFTTIS
jgi:hypothetical protein